MSITKTQATSNAMLDGLDSTYNSGKIRIYSGSAPGSNAAATGTLLLEIDLAADWAAAASGGSKSKSGTLSDTAAGTGMAGYFRIVTSSDTDAALETEARIEGSVTATGGGGDMTLDSVSITSGQTVTINTLTLSV
jgi:hypothetical protein